MIPLDRIGALYLCEKRDDLALLSRRQRSTLLEHIRRAIADAKRRPHLRTGRPISSTHPRARYWREYKRRQGRKATS